MTTWWVGLPDAETRVRCGDEIHTLRWHQGGLDAVDHEDLEGERTLAALSAERCTCVDVLDAWGRHAADLRVLTLASRGPADQLALEVDWLGSSPRAGGRRGSRRGAGSGWAAYGPGGAGSSGLAEADDELIRLLGLNGGLRDRLVATVVAAWADPDQRQESEWAAGRAQLTAALYGRVLSALRSWLGEPSLEVELEVIEPSSMPRLVRLDTGGIQAELPVKWLSDVWARGLTTICGRFALSVELRDGDKLFVSTVGADLALFETVLVGFGQPDTAE